MAQQPKMKWYGPQVIAKVLDLTGDRIERAAREFRDVIREQVSEAGDEPSAPGEYPHKESGHLRRNIQMEFQRTIMTARVGTNVLYGKFLELGTRVMRPRPWLTKALQQYRGRLRQILGRGR